MKILQYIIDQISIIEASIKKPYNKKRQLSGQQIKCWIIQNSLLMVNSLLILYIMNFLYNTFEKLILYE